MDIKELLKIAYKKLKSYVFFDKTQLPLRDKIAAFEKGDFEEQLINLAENIESGSWVFEGGLGSTANGIIKNISCYITPKNLAEDSAAEGVYSNLPHNSVKINLCQYYIDMDVLGHVLGVAWILNAGYALDNESYNNSYGNRLKKNLMPKGNPTYLPYLFEPYFSQYETWRDNGLKQAKKLLSNNKNVIMMTLDFSRFFYSVDIDRETFYEIAENLDERKKIKNKHLDIFLSEFVYNVIEKYSETVKYFDEELAGNRKILPIGFAPSNIIANYCLKKFDDAIIKGWNPTYYGRYVDDVLIIDKVENNSPVYEAVRNQNIDTRFALNYFLVNCDAWRKQDSLCEKNNQCGLFIEKVKLNDKNDKVKDKIEYEYEVNKDFLVFKGSKIVLQNKKAKVFYFDSSQSDILIRCFQKNLQRNISEFRYLPEDEPIFNFDDYTEIYNLQEKAGPNKLNGVEDCGIDKFELSKFLGKYMRISGIVDDKKESRFKKDIAKIFTREVTIENYSAWEKIFAILICNGYFDKLQEFVDIILKHLAAIEVICLKEKSANYKIANLIKKTLIDILYSGLNRTLSVVWGKQMSDIIFELESKISKFCLDQKLKPEREIGIEEIRKYYCLSRMCDKYSLPISIDELIDGKEFGLKDEGDLVNLTSCASFIDCLSDRGKVFGIIGRPNDYIYYPYIFSVMDLTFANLVESLIRGEIEKINCNSEYLFKVYNNLNFNSSEQHFENSQFSYIKPYKNGIKSYVKVGDGEFKKIRIAIANTELADNLLIDLLQSSVDRTYERYQNMGKMVNEAIASKSNMLILPEGYLPIGWLPIFARTCAKNQMAAVVGIEHILLNNCVYNITATILPYVEDKFKFAYIHFHLKRHYAPHEKEIINSRGNNFKEGAEYTLYCWNDFWFPVYCCYELTSINDRALFQSYADAVIAVEWNTDVNYYSNIVESLSRDLHCYCIQVNMSRYGDSRITQPTKTENKDIIRVKGGKNSIILVDEIDLKSLRNFQLKGNLLQKQSKEFKVTPPDFNYKIVQDKKDKKLWDRIKSDLD